jgi:hypothetical protein
MSIRVQNLSMIRYLFVVGDLNIFLQGRGVALVALPIDTALLAELGRFI